jgi:hypothetical protein
MKSSKIQIVYLVAILVMLVVTAYVTTAYFVKFWPFMKATKEPVDLTSIADSIANPPKDPGAPDLSKGVIGKNQGAYDTSDGKAFDCGTYFISFPTGWLRIVKDNGKTVISTDPKDTLNQIIIAEVEGIDTDSKTMAMTVETIKQELGSDYVIDQYELSDFLDRKCIVMSGSANVDGNTEGLMIMAVPDEKGSDYLIVGLYNPKSFDSRSAVSSAMVTLKPKSMSK